MPSDTARLPSCFISIAKGCQSCLPPQFLSSCSCSDCFACLCCYRPRPCLVDAKACKSFCRLRLREDRKKARRDSPSCCQLSICRSATLNQKQSCSTADVLVYMFDKTIGLQMHFVTHCRINLSPHVCGLIYRCLLGLTCEPTLKTVTVQ